MGPLPLPVPARCAVLCASIAGIVAGAARATETLFTLVPSESSVVSTVATATPMNGSFIGDYDATANPTGTKTLPGLFGGSTNTAIPYTSTVEVAGGVDTPLSGTFSLIDGFGGPVIDGLSLVHAQANPGSADLTLTINYQSFHTVNPTGLFPGDIDVPLPLGSADVTGFAIVQQSPVSVVMTQLPDGTTQASALVPVIVTMEASVQGAPVDLAPTAAVLPLTGTYVTGPAGTELLLAASQSETSAVPGTGVPFENQPLDIPTVLPAGGTAHLLMSGLAGDTAVTVTLDLSIRATGEVAGVPGDINGDGAVDGGDLALLLGAWGTSDPAADLDGNGTVSASDLTVLLSAWS